MVSWRGGRRRGARKLKAVGHKSKAEIKGIKVILRLDEATESLSARTVTHAIRVLDLGLLPQRPCMPATASVTSFF
jgi:hypothetical protein